MVTSSTTNPLRGEIWQVDHDPTRGSEIKKSRPVIVMSSDVLRSLPLRVVVAVERFSKKLGTLSVSQWLLPFLDFVLAL